jgi:hypothetical protein
VEVVCGEVDFLVKHLGPLASKLELRGLDLLSAAWNREVEVGRLAVDCYDLEEH